MLKAIVKLLKMLNSETDPNQISLAFAFSLITGLTPILSLHNILVLFFVLVLRVNISSFLLGTVFFSGIAYILDPIFHKLGLIVLTAAQFEGLWTTLYNSPFWRIENFNNTIVMGSLIFSITLFIPIHILIKQAIIKYRETIFEWVQKTRLMQILKASKIYSIYHSFAG